MLVAGLNQVAEIGERAKLRMYGIMTALDISDGVGTARIAGLRLERIVAPLAIRAANRMNGR